MTFDNFVPVPELNDIWDNSRSMAKEKDKADAEENGTQVDFFTLSSSWSEPEIKEN